MKFTGSCQCKAVNVSVKLCEDQQGYHVCHCGICLRTSGGPVMGVPVGQAATITGEDNITVYGSTPWMERGFCKTCGTKVFFRVKETGDLHLSVWLFDNADVLKFESQIFIDRKPDSYCFGNNTPTMTEAEFEVKYS